VKIKKCVAFGIMRIGTRYQLFAPHLTYDNATIPTPIDQPLRFLGQLYFTNISQLEAHISQKLANLLRTLDDLPILGSLKLQAFSFALRWTFSWDLSIYDVSPTFLAKQDRRIGTFLRKWSGLARCGGREIFFLPVKHCGLGLPSLTSLHKACRATFWAHLQNTRDPDIQARLRLCSEELNVKYWRPFLCNLPRTPAAAPRQAARAASAEAVKAHDAKCLELLQAKQWQGAIVRELCNTDTAWNAAAYNLPPSLLRFGLNAVVNTLPSLNNLRRWKLTDNSLCPLCGKEQTILHVLSNCAVSLTNGKYEWRHNCVLRRIANFLQAKLPFSADLLVDHLPNHPCHYTHLPPDVSPSTRRPDIVVMDKLARLLWFVELTVPDEENIGQAHQRKVAAYTPLVADAVANGWSPLLFTVEFGTRGFNNGSLHAAMRSVLATLKVPRTSWSSDLKGLIRDCSRVALHASYIIWLTRSSSNFALPPDL
jgi:hypothetical protein